MPTTPEVWLSEQQVNTSDIGAISDDQVDSVTIQLTTGNIVVLWVDATYGAPDEVDVIGQIYDPPGAAIGGEFVANSFTSGEQRNFDAAALDNGSFVVVYEDQSAGALSDYDIRVTEWTTNSNGTIGSATDRLIESSTATNLYSEPSVASQSDGISTAKRDRIKELERENRQLRQANEILKKASAYFAQAEFYRPFRK